MSTLSTPLALVFHSSVDMSITGISAIYVEFTTSLSILKGSVDIN